MSHLHAVRQVSIGWRRPGMGALTAALIVLGSLGHGLAQDDAERIEALEGEVQRLQERLERLEAELLVQGPLTALRFLEAGGFHAMDEALAQGEMDPRYEETVRTTAAVVGAVAWPEELREPVEAFLAAANELVGALREEDVDAAAEAAAGAHDAQHVLSQTIVAYAGDDVQDSGESDAGAAAVDDASAEIPEGAERVELELGEQGGAVGGAQTWRVNVGDTVALQVRSAAAGELHLHGLGGDWELSEDEELVAVVEAEATGRFPLEFHPGGGERGVTVAYVEVHP